MRTSVFRISVLLILGWGISRFLFSILRTVELGSFSLLLGFASALVLCFVLVGVLREERSTSVLYVLCGILSDSIFYWIVRPGSHARYEVTGPWDRLVFIGSTAGLAIVVLFAIASRVIGHRRRSRIHGPSLLQSIFVSSAACVGVLVFRSSYFFTIHIPNEERSLFIMGCEIHHATTGSIALVVVALLIAHRVIENGLLTSFLVGVVSSFILDQATYSFISDLSDEAYGSLSSWAGAAVATTLFMTYSLASTPRKRGNAGEEESD